VAFITLDYRIPLSAFKISTPLRRSNQRRQKESQLYMYAQEVTLLVNQLSGPNRKRILSREEEREAAIAWQERRDEAARLLIMQCHVKFVAKEVRRMRHYKAAPSDLISEGMIGLTVALDKYDPDSGFRFSTYAIHWVRSKLNEYLLQTEGVMRLSNSEKQRKMLFGYRKAMAHVLKKSQNQGPEMTRTALREKVATMLNVSVEDIHRFENAMNHANSLEAPRGSSEGQTQTLADVMPDTAPLAEDVLNENQCQARMKSDIAKALEKLNAREKNIILTRKMADEDEALTLEDLSQIHKVSRERIRQIEVQALNKLRQTLAPTRALLAA
jgi:RNA polymerase sigma-32 factor